MTRAISHTLILLARLILINLFTPEIRALARQTISWYSSLMLITESTITKLVFTVGNTAGVYFLKQSGRIIYIGKSTNVLSRIFAGHVGVKEFDEVEIHWMDKSIIANYEKQQIAVHRPPLNDWDNRSKRSKTMARLAR